MHESFFRLASWQLHDKGCQVVQAAAPGSKVVLGVVDILPGGKADQFDGRLEAQLAANLCQGCIEAFHDQVAEPDLELERT